MGTLKQHVAGASRKQRRFWVVVTFELFIFLVVAFILVRVFGPPDFLTGRSRQDHSGSQTSVPWSHEIPKQASASFEDQSLWAYSSSEVPSEDASRQVKLFERIIKAEEEESKDTWSRGFLEQDLADMFAKPDKEVASVEAQKAKAHIIQPEPVLPSFVKEAISTTDSLAIQFQETDPRLLSQKGQDKWLLRTLFKGGNQQSGRGFFVEFGARNGQEESNSYFFEKVLGWHGILAEASPADQRDIATNRTHSAVVNGAMCKDESKREYGELEYGLSGLVEKYDPKRMIERQVSMKKMQVQCYRLDKVLEFFGVKAIDYMSVDTEGSELDALSAFPFDRIPCQIIGIEVLIGPGREGRTNKTVDFMAERGYRLFHPFSVAPDTLDMFFVLKHVPDPSVFSRPRVDVEKFFEARGRCQGLGRMCL